MLSVVYKKFQALGLVCIARESEYVVMSVKPLTSRVHRFALGEKTGESVGITCLDNTKNIFSIASQIS